MDDLLAHYDLVVRKSIPDWWKRRASLGRGYNFRDYEVVFNVDDYVAVHGAPPKSNDKGTWTFRRSRRSKQAFVYEGTYVAAKVEMWHHVISQAISVNELRLNESDRRNRYPNRLRVYLSEQATNGNE